MILIIDVIYPFRLVVFLTQMPCPYVRSTEKLTSELQSRESKCMMLYQRLQHWPECNALAHKLLLKK